MLFFSNIQPRYLICLLTFGIFVGSINARKQGVEHTRVDFFVFDELLKEREVNEKQTIGYFVVLSLEHQLVHAAKSVISFYH